MKETCFCGSLNKCRFLFEKLEKNASFYVPNLNNSIIYDEETLLQQHFSKMLDSKKIVILTDGILGDTVTTELQFALEHKLWIKIFNIELKQVVLELNNNKN